MVIGNHPSFNAPSRKELTHWSKKIVNGLEQIVPGTVRIQESVIYRDVRTIKVKSAKDPICIITLEDEIEISFQIGIPLCLPEIPNKHYDTVPGTVFGYGYSEDGIEYVKDLARTKDKMEERKLYQLTYEVLSSTKCMERFGRDWALRRRSSVDAKGGQFFWIKK